MQYHIHLPFLSNHFKNVGGDYSSCFCFSNVKKKKKKKKKRSKIMEGRDGESSAVVTKTSSSSSLSHRRSKSASDRNPDSGRHCVAKECNGSQNFLHIMKHEAQHSVRQDSSGNSNYASLGHRNSLENDVNHLQLHLHQEKSVRVVLERAIGRASSTLSPGHRNSAIKTRELISEIELLEEEIANREQHVLSLYKNFFDQCASGPSSGNNSGMVSPAHVKSGMKKHPSIISSAFCSSKKFRLQSFQVLGSIKESGRSNALLKPKVRHESLSEEKANFHAGSNQLDSMELPPTGRSYLARTLKDHLYQCPSKLSEEMVRCIAAIYCWVRSETSSVPDKARSPFLSRSSTSVILPGRGAGDDREWSSRSIIEISSISIDERHCSSASYAINNYRLLVEQLERVDASVMEYTAKLAFWINVHNSLVMHAYLAYGIPQSSLRRMALFHKAAYKIGGYIVTASSIEHSILCCRTHRIGRWFETILSAAMRKKSGDEKQLHSSKFSLIKSQPLVLFSLCTGAASDPMLRVYTAKNVIEELEKAKKEFLQASVAVKKSRKVFLPKILERYAKETYLNCDDLLVWVSDNIDKKLQEAIQRCVASENKKKLSQVIEWLPYNTRFCYVFGKDLTEKPWWV